MPAQHVALAGHPDNATDFRQRVDAAVTRLPGGGLALAYAVRGSIGALRLPTPEHPAPADALWSTTCCELFVAADAAKGYREFNVSPSGQWAVYDFSCYRERAAEQPACPAPTMAMKHEQDALRLDVELPASALPAGDAWRIGLAAVLMTRDGHLGYWALEHAPGKPDFHHPSAFALAIDKECP